MINIIIEISLFLIVAILLGYTFGWFTSKAMLKEKYERQIYEFNTLYEDKLITLAKKHEEEMDAFLYERTEITQKYKELLAKLNEKEVDPDVEDV